MLSRGHTYKVRVLSSPGRDELLRDLRVPGVGWIEFPSDARTRDALRFLIDNGRPPAGTSFAYTYDTDPQDG